MNYGFFANPNPSIIDSGSKCFQTVSFTSTIIIWWYSLNIEYWIRHRNNDYYWLLFIHWINALFECHSFNYLSSMFLELIRTHFRFMHTSISSDNSNKKDHASFGSVSLWRIPHTYTHRNWEWNGRNSGKRIMWTRLIIIKILTFPMSVNNMVFVFPFLKGRKTLWINNDSNNRAENRKFGWNKMKTETEKKIITRIWKNGFLGCFFFDCVEEYEMVNILEIKYCSESILCSRCQLAIRSTFQHSWHLLWWKNNKN